MCAERENGHFSVNFMIQLVVCYMGNLVDGAFIESGL